MKEKFLDFIEIGTSDFSTEIQKTNCGSGISIEPVKFYFDKLPEKKNVLKLNIAISNKIGKCTVYYVPEHNIKKYKLPEYVRGCNTINILHKTVQNICNEKNININDIIEFYDVDVKTLHDVYISQNICGVYYLKIDTEGHDTIILKQFFFDLKDNLLFPHKILFESNSLSEPKNVNEIINLYSDIGYDLIYKNNDTLLKLNLKKIKKQNKFTNIIANYNIYCENSEENIVFFNDLDDAKKYCIDNNSTGILCDNDKFIIKNGKYLEFDNDKKIILYL